MDSPAPDPADPDVALIAALRDGATADGEPSDGSLTRAELAARAQLPVAVVEALERQGLIAAGEVGYDAADVELLRAGRVLLDAGVPLGELLDLARRLDASLRDLAGDAVETFVRFVRDPAHAEAHRDGAAERLIEAYRVMLPAASTLVGEHFRRLLLRAARARAAAEADGVDGDVPQP